MLQVNGGKRDGTQNPVTELLVYAAVERREPVLPTPPTSSSPEQGSESHIDDQTASSQRPFKFHALPLSSERFKHVQRAKGLCTPPPEDGNAYIVPETAEQLEALVKKRKISSVFDAATKQRRKSKAKGGESIAKTMADLERSSSSQSLAQLPQLLDSSATQASHKKGPLKAPLTRAASDPSQSSQLLILDETQPSSRAGAITNRKRSSLHRVESAYSVREGSTTSEPHNEILEQNKTQLAKIIMAGMRLHGLQQRKRPGTATSRPSHSRSASAHPLPVGPPNEDDEYKLVYHQTHKAVMFAFRAHCNTKAISQDAMRDVVDQMLDLFCTDPLLPSPINDSFVVGRAEDNPFDPPSSSAPMGESQVWSTPVTKKRKMNLG